MSCEPVPPIHLDPLQAAPETFLIRSAQPALGAPMTVGINSVVIRGAEPVLVDTGSLANRDGWRSDVFSLVDPADVRWIFLSHEDPDHIGNLVLALDECPNATLVTTWAATERLSCEIGLPPERVRWVDDGESFDAGDRTLRAVRPPVYDGPATRGLFDPVTRVYWSSDAFATPMGSEPVDHVGDLPAPMWSEGMAVFHHHALSPWLGIVDRERYAADVRRVRSLDPAVVVGCHTPVIDGDHVDAAFELLAALPGVVPPPHPDQTALEAALAGT
jgi:flavorubredoxin